MRRLNFIDWIALVLVIIGALNWLLTAFGFNLVNAVFGAPPVPPSAVSVILYLLIGAAGLWLIYLAYRLAAAGVRLNIVDWIAIAFVVLGSLLWLSYGLGLDIGGSEAPASALSTILYIIIGLSGLWMIYLVTRITGTRTEA